MEEGMMSEFQTILLTTDFSDTSRLALQPTRALVQRFGARVVLVHVEEDRLPPLVVEYMAVGVEEMLTHQVEHSQKRLGEFATEHLAGLEGIECVVGVGTPHVEIVRIAEERNVDLIVMATHGRGLISHALLGSTAERVLRRAPCPVLIVPQSRID
jgi:nucleotide-binding universal stress UspA family protein